MKAYLSRGLISASKVLNIQQVDVSAESTCFCILTVLGSNDPNTIPDLTRIRCSCFSIVPYGSARTPLCLDLDTFYVSLGLRYFPVTFSRDS